METINLNQSGIYAIVSPSGKRYVGQAVNIAKRWKEHKSGLRAGKHHCSGLQNAYYKYGEALDYVVLELCSRERDTLTAREQFHMDSSCTGLYNSAPAAGSQLGMVHTEATKAKLRSHNLGKSIPQDTREKISASLLGTTRPQATREKIRASSFGKVLSRQTREKISLAGTGRVTCQETRKLLSEANLGKVKPESYSKKVVGAKKKNNTSGYCGVTQNKRGGSWRAERCILGKTIQLGTYPTAALAGEARQNFDRILDYYSHS